MTMSNYAILPTTHTGTDAVDTVDTAAPAQESKATVATYGDEAGAAMVNKALEYLGKPPQFTNGDGDSDADIRPLCAALAEQGHYSFQDVFKTIGGIANTADDEETWKITRRILSKVMGSCTRDLFYKVRRIERKQESARNKGIDITVGEIETYTYPAFDEDRFTVAEYYDAVEDIKAIVDKWNDVIVAILGWGGSEEEGVGGEFAIPYCWVLDGEKLGETQTTPEDYIPAHTLGEAFMGLGRVEDHKKAVRKQSAQGMLAALLAS